MTLGQRIAQKRKEQALSQEALGEELGVSRQSVYKWESGSATPEIDKLVAMSRLFGVSVGWLLGVEEPEGAAETEREAGPPPEAGEPELTETQLKMVEAIAERYLAARQPPRRRWLWAAGAAAGLVLLLALHSLRGDLQRMRNDYSNLQYSISSVTRSVDNQISSIANRVEEVLKSQNSLTAGYGTEVVSGDLAANTVTFSAHAAPKTYTEGMTAVFLVDNGVEVREVPAGVEAGQVFSARMTCGLTDSISISVVFITGDVREKQLLEEYRWLYSNSLPDAVWPESSDMSIDRRELNEAGELCWSGEDYAYFPNTSSASAVAVYDFGRAALQSLRVGLFRNQALVCWLESCPMPEKYRNSSAQDFVSVRDFFRFPEVSVKAEEGDEFRLCTVAVDEYGREFICQGIPYVLDAGWNGLRMADGGSVGLPSRVGW